MTTTTSGSAGSHGVKQGGAKFHFMSPPGKHRLLAKHWWDKCQKYANLWIELIIAEKRRQMHAPKEMWPGWQIPYLCSCCWLNPYCGVCYTSVDPCAVAIIITHKMVFAQLEELITP